MRVCLVVGLLGLLVVGCGRKAPPRPVGVSRLDLMPVATSPEAARQPSGSQATAKDQAEEWGPRLCHVSDEIRQQAVLVLRTVGDEAYPHVLKALRSRSSDDRYAGLEVLNQEMLIRHAVELVPALLDLLDDRQPDIRRRVIELLPQVDQQVSETDIQVGPYGQQRLEALRKVAQTDRDPAIQQLAADTVPLIYQAIRGKVGELPPRTDLPSGSRTGEVEAPSRRDLPRR